MTRNRQSQTDQKKEGERKSTIISRMAVTIRLLDKSTSPLCDASRACAHSYTRHLSAANHRNPLKYSTENENKKKKKKKKKNNTKTLRSSKQSAGFARLGVLYMGNCESGSISCANPIYCISASWRAIHIPLGASSFSITLIAMYFASRFQMAQPKAFFLSALVRSAAAAIQYNKARALLSILLHFAL